MDGRTTVHLPFDEYEGMTEKQTIEVSFIHPWHGSKLIADVIPQCTGQELLSALHSHADGEDPYLTAAPQGRSYELSLQRTSQAIARNMTLEEVGVVNGDCINIVQSVLGAGSMSPYWLELGEMVFWSAAAASVFLKYASPILVEFLRGRSSRSIKIRDGNYEIELTGESPNKALEILEFLKKRREVSDVSSVTSDDRLASPITITLCDSKSSEAREDDSS